MTLHAHADELAGEVGLDPLTILAFLSAVLPLVMECFRTPEEAAEHFRQDTRATRAQIARACRDEWRQAHTTPVPMRLVRAVQRRLAIVDAATMRDVWRQAA